MNKFPLVTVVLKKPILVVDLAKGPLHVFRISLPPAKYELEPISVVAPDGEPSPSIWYLIKGTQYGLSFQEWKTHVQEWPG